MDKNDIDNRGVNQALNSYKEIVGTVKSDSGTNTENGSNTYANTNPGSNPESELNHKEKLYNEELTLERAEKRAKDVDKSISYKTTKENLEIEKIKQRNRTSEILNDCLTDINETEKEKQPERNKIANFILTLLKFQLMFLGIIVISIIACIIFKVLTNVEIIKIIFQYLTKLTLYTIVETFALLAYVVRYLFRDTIKPKYDFLKLVLYEQENKKDDSKQDSSRNKSLTSKEVRSPKNK